MPAPSFREARSAKPNPKPGKAIVAQNLVRHFDNGLVHALDGVDLEISQGEKVAIMGPTGCGKSTLLHILALLDQPDGGSLWMDGRPADSIRPAEAWRAHRVGIIFQLHHLLSYLTAEENVRLALTGCSLSRCDQHQRVRSILEHIGLRGRAGTYAAKLSGGERQLTAVARALVRKPALVLADEPTGSVDSSTGQEILRLIFEHGRHHNATVILVTHDAEVAERADRRIVMKDGRIVRDDAP